MAKHLIRHKGLQYPVVVQADEVGGFWVSCPVLSGCYSQGETIDEALQNIKEAIELCEETSTTGSHQMIKDVSLHFVTL